MSATTSSSADQALAEITGQPDPDTIEEVIARMEAIDAALPNDDGLKWFNRLYLMVTRDVDLNPPGGAWQNANWLLGLDVVFARYYFGAIRGYLAATGTSSSWSVLFESRNGAGIDRIQFALAGMNAHINYDLAQALVDSDAFLQGAPGAAGPEHADYQAVNALLETVMPSALNMLAGDTMGLLAEDTGKVGRLLAFWNICRARDLAWDCAGYLRGTNGLARRLVLNTQDAITGALGRAILAMVDVPRLICD